MSSSRQVAGSFRDPSGFVFETNDTLYRQINPGYADDYDLLMQSGLYDALTSKGLLVSHETADQSLAPSQPAHCVIRPEAVPFISYPCEWSFSQLKDAALATLAIQRRAVEHGMVLKDASAYNIQFLRGRPVMIDTLSFEAYSEGQPWVAYRQFCQHFLAPLALMAHRDARLGSLLRSFIDGVPLDLASTLLPWRTKLTPGLLTHLHLHSKSQARYADRPDAARRPRGGFSKLAMLGLLDSLEGAVRKLRWRAGGTEWADYYDETNYCPEALGHKEQLIARFIDELQPRVIWDLGANTGRFSRIAAGDDRLVVSFDIDPAAVERNYLEAKERGEKGILPLVLDLTNPSPATGWHHSERMSLLQRGPADTALALALVHHLAIGNNVPLPRVADFFADACATLIVEFVPKSDSQVQRMLASREDVFEHYHREGFEEAFSERFVISECDEIDRCDRVLYLMEVRH